MMWQETKSIETDVKNLVKKYKKIVENGNNYTSGIEFEFEDMKPKYEKKMNSLEDEFDEIWPECHNILKAHGITWYKRNITLHSFAYSD